MLPVASRQNKNFAGWLNSVYAQSNRELLAGLLSTYCLTFLEASLLVVIWPSDLGTICALGCPNLSKRLIGTPSNGTDHFQRCRCVRLHMHASDLPLGSQNAEKRFCDLSMRRGTNS